jgi:hypothetical protein
MEGTGDSVGNDTPHGDKTPDEEQGQLPLEAPTTAPDFTPDDLLRFFAEKWKLKACEVCEVPGTWNVPFRSSMIGMIPAGGPGDPVSTLSPRVMGALIILCSNCGNVKFLSNRFIETWLKQNPAT